MTAEINTSLFKHTVSLNQLPGWGQTISPFMWAWREVMHVRGSQIFAYTKRGGGGWFRSVFILAFTMAYRLSCNSKRIVGAQEEMGKAKGTTGCHLPVPQEKLVRPQSTHTQTNVNMRGSHLLGPKLRGKGIPKGCIQERKGNINTIIRGIYLTQFQGVAIAYSYTKEISVPL